MAWVDSYTLPLALLRGDAAAAAIRDTARLRPGAHHRRAQGRDRRRVRRRRCVRPAARRRGRCTRRSRQSVAACGAAGRHRRRIDVPADAQVVGRSRRPEQQPRVRRRTVRPEAVSPHRAGAEPRARDRARARRAGGSRASRRSSARSLYERPDLEPGTLAIVQRAITHQGPAGTTRSTSSALLRARVGQRAGGRPDEGASGLATAPDGPPPPFLAARRAGILNSGHARPPHGGAAPGARRATRSGVRPRAAGCRAAARAIAIGCDPRGRSRSTCFSSARRRCPRPIRPQAERVLAARARIRRSIQTHPRRSSSGGTRHPHSRRLPPRAGAARPRKTS